MNAKLTETGQPQAEPATTGGCCGGHGSGPAADARPEAQAGAAKSGGCCCGKGNDES